MSDWHLDKRVPVALITTLLIQAGLGVWWASNASERLEQVERRLEGFAVRSSEMRKELESQGRTVAVLLNRIENTNNNLDRLRSEVTVTNNLLRELVREVGERP